MATEDFYNESGTSPPPTIDEFSDLSEQLVGEPSRSDERMVLSSAPTEPIECDDSTSLKDFREWLNSLLNREGWIQVAMAKKRANKLKLQLSEPQIKELLKLAEHEARGISIKGRGRRSLQQTDVGTLWEGMIPAGRAACIVGLPKSNKTQLVLNMVGAWWAGKSTYLGRGLNGDCPPVIIVGTDQTEQDWVSSLRRAGLSGDIDPDMESTPIVELWSGEQGLALNAEGIEVIREVVEENPGALVICDSIRKLVVAPLGIEEKDARLITPLQKLELELAPYEATVVYIHHAGKGRAGESPITAGAGGTALPGHVTNMVGLQKLSDRDDEQRVQAWIDGRLGRESKFYFDASIDGFKLLGNGTDISRMENMRKAEERLTDVQEEVLFELRKIYSANHLPVTSECLCHALGDKYMKNGKPYFQLVNSKLHSLKTKFLVDSQKISTQSGQMMGWTPIQLPSV